MLAEIYAKYAHLTDKGTAHDYIADYEELWGNRKPKRLLEVGVFRGGSLRMWREWTGGEVIGVDVDRTVDVEELCKLGIRIVIGDSREPLPLAGQFDAIIDDGNHDPEVQVATFRNLSPLLEPDGVYVIEDCHAYQLVRRQLMADGEFSVEVRDRRSRERWDNVLLIVRRTNGKAL